MEQAVCRERLTPGGSLRCVQRKFLIADLQSDVGKMVAHICHDLRLPLTAILASAEFLTQADISETEKNEFYQEIRWSIDRMNEMIISLLDYSKGCDTFHPAFGSIVDTVERAIRMVSTRKEFRNITIKHDHKGIGLGWFDPNRLERVVANLVLNACEAVSPDSGLIVITTIGNHAALRIGVWDNGPGIPSAIHDSIFQPFVSYGKAEGSGLGLAIAKKIVEDHGGEICLDGGSETGTLFKITIPFCYSGGSTSAHVCRSDLLHGHVKKSGE